MKRMFSGKATRQSVSIPQDMMETVCHQIQSRGITFSAYIQELIGHDLTLSEQLPESNDENALVHLAETFHPTVSREIQEWASHQEDFKQPFFLYRMLCALHEAIERNDPILSLKTVCQTKGSEKS